jgi:hypothetical protein
LEQVAQKLTGNREKCRDRDRQRQTERQIETELTELTEDSDRQTEHQQMCLSQLPHTAFFFVFLFLFCSLLLHRPFVVVDDFSLFERDWVVS